MQEVDRRQSHSLRPVIMRSHGSKLALWNQGVLRDTLEKASAENPNRSAVEQKIGDYYASCMDEGAIDTKGVKAIASELARISALKDKNQLAEEVAHLHQITFALLPGSNSGAQTPLFGFGQGQDLDDASKVVASADQGGLGLPDRDYYLKDDAKSIETRQQYVAHLQKVFELLGEDPIKAAADAKVVMDMETHLAKSSMDIVKRRDPAEPQPQDDACGVAGVDAELLLGRLSQRDRCSRHRALSGLHARFL